MEIFRSFNQVGVTVLVATHDAALVERFGSHAVRLDHGRIVTGHGARAAA
jgi:cell division transport system ATP-binding protein